MNRFCQETLDIMPSILNAVKSTFNMLSNTAQKTVKFGWILKHLVSTFGGPDAIAGLLKYSGLPVIPQKAFVTENVAIFDSLQDDLSRLAFIGVGGNQIIDKRHAIQRRQHDQFVAKVVQVAGRAVTIASTARKSAVRFSTLVTQHRDRLRIDQQLFRVVHPKLSQPFSTQHFYQVTQATGATIVLALVNQFRKLAPVIGSDIAQVLRFPWIWYEILGQHQRHHLTILELWLGTRFPPQERLPLAEIPVIYQDQDGCQKAHHVYTCGHRCVVPGWS